MRYASIRNLDISNGCNIGIALFVQGCDFHCHGCFNQETWDFENGEEWTEDVKKSFIELANSPHIQRISILGGEPLHHNNIQDVLQLCKEIKNIYPEKNIWVYTGYTLDSFWAKEGQVVTDDFDIWKVCANTLLQYIDVLVDGKYVQELRDITLPFRGSTNQRVIDVQKTLKKQRIVLYENN